MTTHMAGIALRHINADIANQLVFKVSLLPQLKLRLLSIGNAANASETAPAFCALSYCCSTAPISCHFQSSAHGRNLVLPLSNLIASAIMQDAKTFKLDIWCDQICIDQSNMAERAITLSFTDAIYNSASFVAIALDDVLLDSTDEAFLRWFRSHLQKDLTTPADQRPLWPFRGQSPPFAKNHPQLSIVFRKIIAAQWFSRAWCAHEMRAGSRSMIYVACNQNKVVVRMSIDFLNLLGRLTKELPLPDHFDEGDMEHESVALQSLRQGMQSVIPRVSLLENFRQLDYLKTGGNPQAMPQLREQTATLDKFIITLNSSLCGFSLSEETFRKASQEIVEPGFWHRRLVALALALRDPLALCSSEIPPYACSKLSVAPWWFISRFGDTPDSTRNSMSTTNYLQSFDFDMNRFDDFIKIRLSVPSFWTHREASLRHVQLAISIIYAAAEISTPNPDALSEMPTKLLWLRTFRGHRVGPSIQILGCILDCGVQWLRNLASLENKDFVSFVPDMKFDEVMRTWTVLGELWPSCLDINTYQNEQDLAESPVVRSTLQAWMSTEENLAAIRLVLELTRWICAGEVPGRWIQPVDREPYRPYIWTLGEGQLQREYIVVHHDKYRERKKMLAIPEILLEDRFHDIRRCWLVDRSNPGDMPPVFQICERHRIYGPSVQDVFNICGKVKVLGPKDE